MGSWLLGVEIVAALGRVGWWWDIDTHYRALRRRTNIRGVTYRVYFVSGLGLWMSI